MNTNINSGFCFIITILTWSRQSTNYFLKLSPLHCSSVIYLGFTFLFVNLSENYFGSFEIRSKTLIPSGIVFFSQFVPLTKTSTSLFLELIFVKCFWTTGVYSTNGAQILLYKVREYFLTSAEA